MNMLLGRVSTSGKAANKLSSESKRLNDGIHSHPRGNSLSANSLKQGWQRRTLMDQFSTISQFFNLDVIGSYFYQDIGVWFNFLIDNRC